MPVPSYQAFFRPLLTHTSDGIPHSMRELRATLADGFHLSPEEQAAQLKSGETVLSNRVWWARTYLAKAGLLTSKSRGEVEITDEGRAFLTSHPTGIALSDLRTIQSFDAWYQESGKQVPRAAPGSDPAGLEPQGTPEERMEAAYGEHQAAVCAELLEAARTCSPSAFERLVVRLLQKMGYGAGVDGAGRAVGASGDGGIDGVIDEDALGLSRVYIQAKRWQNAVGEPPLRDFVGALASKHVDRGVFITTSTFTGAARTYVRSLAHRLVLIDGEQLARFLLAYEVGVNIRQGLALYRVDPEYFQDL